MDRRKETGEGSRSHLSARHDEEVQAGAGASGSGSGPSRTEIGLDHDNKFSRDAIGGPLGGRVMHHSREEGYSVFSDKENNAGRTIAPRERGGDEDRGTGRDAQKSSSAQSNRKSERLGGCLHRQVGSFYD
ncbi:hypothetical protein ACSQ67_024383 [Phaseolus vulgaris]